MATISFPGIVAYQKQLEALGKNGTDKAIHYAIYPAADVVADEIKDNIPVSDDPRTSGDLRRSMILTPMQDDGTGFIYTQIKFAGYDAKGAPMPLVARVLESGRSSPSGKVGKHPFIRQAVNRTKQKAEQLMQVYLDRYINDFMKRK